MKRLFLPLLVFFAFVGCKEDVDPASTVIGQWKLISIGGGWGQSIQTGSDMIYSQTYQFNRNGTFVKTQETDGQSAEASGTFTTEPGEIMSSADVKLYVQLEFTEGEELAGDCGPGSEHLILRNNNQLINTWGMCDGPILTYDKN
ncbi:hypothetical protein [Algoriphagus sp. A40]|uniref:hypothetical protein n=1 Tax=Algoriphagus sp. A40 TaxID=1945863 RepID=UPI000986C979|nr:hypothetical protein [Algoriphagus sp. A40]OOG72303.1 hypothetical protein B0E43_15500 [Algoriphagus sp. A40]